VLPTHDPVILATLVAAGSLRWMDAGAWRGAPTPGAKHQPDLVLQPALRHAAPRTGDASRLIRGASRYPIQE